MIRTSTPRRNRRVRILACRDLEALESRTLMAVFTVNSTADILSPPAGVVTLRSAIQAANTTAGADTIDIPAAGTYRITTLGKATDNSAGEFAITGASGLTIQNTSGGVVTIDGGGLNRVFDINLTPPLIPITKPPRTVTATFDGLTITDGVTALNTNGGGIDVQGRSNLVLNQCVVTGNAAGFGGGGIAMESGGIGSLTLTGTQVVRNLAEAGGGGIASFGTGTIAVGGQSFLGNNTAAGPKGGGGVYLSGPKLTITGSTLSGNRAIAGPGGGVENASAASTSVTIAGGIVQGNFSEANGGGYDDADGSALLTVTNSFFLDNATVGNGGGLEAGDSVVTLTNTTLAGNSAESGGGADFPGPGSDVLIQGGTVSGNSAATSGGGLSVEAVNEFDLFDSTVEGNFTLPFGFGAGIGATLTNGNLSVSDCLFTGNVTAGIGGALGGSGGFWSVSDSRLTGNTAGVGGAMDISPNSFSINDNTIDNNRSSGDAGAMLLGLGSGSSGLENDTITDNAAGGFAGALELTAGSGSVALVDDTIDGNTSATQAGGVYQNSNNTVNVKDTILAGNTAAGAASDYDYAFGTLNDKGGNLLGSTAGDGGKFSIATIVANPKLGPLVDNGNAGGNLAGAPSTSQVVPTQALLPGSPAIAKGIADITQDERGFDRATKPSIGAYEPQYAATATANQVFVENLYEVLLGRAADPSGLAGGAAFLNGGGTPTALAQALEGSGEYLKLEANQLVRRYLDRAPTASEVTNVTAFLAAGHTPEQAAAIFINSPEFAADYGNSQDAFIEALYQTTLGRAAEPTEVAAWDSMLVGGLSRPAMVNLFLTSDGYLSDLIAADFQAYLGRPPRPTEAAACLAAMHAGFSDASLAALVLGTAESFADRT